MTKIVYIHGAFCTGLSFTRIKENLPQHVAVLPEYAVEQPLQEVIARISSQITHEGEDVHIVAHSLGGLVAVAVAQRNTLVKSVVTMGSPFGGSVAADAFKWFSSHQLYQSLDKNGSVIRSIQDNLLPCPVRCIITTSGNNPMLYEANDGVVSIKSQMALKSAERIRVNINHSEVLMSDVAIGLVKEFIFGQT